MRKRRIQVLVVILIILNVAFAQEENDSSESNEEKSESYEQDQSPENEEGDNKDEYEITKLDNDKVNPNKKNKPYHQIILEDQNVDVPDNHHIIDSYKKDQQCKCNDGLDCKCDNATIGNIKCHCADFDNLAQLNKGYACKCEKGVLNNIQLKCQCARQDSRQSMIKTITCTSVATFKQSHIRDISFGSGGKLQLYEKDEQEKNVLMTGIKDVNDILPFLNGSIVYRNYVDVIVDIRHLTEINATILLKHFVFQREFRLQKFTMCGCKNVTGVSLCYCNENNKKIVHYVADTKPIKCLCMPLENKSPKVECMCNEHSHEPKILYYPQFFEIFKCDCSKSDNEANFICKCNERANFVYQYEKILVDIRAVEEDHITNIQMQLGEIMEFKKILINPCNCTYAEPSWNCDCSLATTAYTSQKNLANCLCVDPKKYGKNNQCLCCNHILELTVLFNSEQIDMYGCICYNQNSQSNPLSLKCECKQREDKQEKYDDVVVDISKITNANLTHVVTGLNKTAQFYKNHIDFCQCNYDKETLLCNCSTSMESYTKEHPSKCLYLESSQSGTLNGICNPNLHSINIIYALDIKFQECLCSQFLISKNSLSCECNNKISYNYDYKNAMIDIVHWSQYTLATILVQLLHTIEYSREHFNLCICIVENGKYSCACNDITNSHEISNCFCISDNVFLTSEYKYCMCNLHFRTNESIRIRYQQTDDKYIEECSCNRGENEKSLICGKCALKGSLHRFSEKPYEGEVNIPHTIENQLEIILNIVFKNFVQQDRENNKCQCTENLQDCICDHNLRPYESPKGEVRCLCVADYYYIERPLRCACNPRILDRDVKFNERLYDIRFCYAYARHGDKNRVYCKLQRPPLPKYDFVIGITTTAVVHVHTLREYIIQARSDFEKEKFNMCNCKKVNKALECNCVENTEIYTKSHKVSCQCILYGEDSGFECICNPHILQFELSFYAHRTDIDGCRCYHNEIAGEKQLTCGECIKRTPLETHPRWTLNPIYRDIPVIIPNDAENQLHVIISYILKIFNLNDRVINYCQCTNNFKDFTCKYPIEPYILEGAGQLHCLCLNDFYYNDKSMQCACNPHVLETKLTYLTSKYDIRRAHCFIPAETSNGTDKNIICHPADVDGIIDHAADRVVIDIKKSLIIHAKNIFEYIIQHDEYKHEKFTFCTCTNDDGYQCSCDNDTSKYTVNHERNCLCIVPNNSTENIECLCNSIVLQFGIMLEENCDLEACRCYHSVDALNENQLICTSCIKRVSYEQNPHFIYDKNYTGNVIIKPNTDNQLLTIITQVVKQFNINDRVVNYCKCKEDLTDFICKYPVPPYLLLNKDELKCFCVADYYYTVHPIRCGCNPYVLQPKVIHSAIKYDFRFVTCSPRNNRLICEQHNKEIVTGQINKIAIEVTESRIFEISHFVDYILEQKGYTGEHINICGCEENNDAGLFCNCNGPTQSLTIRNTGSCLCLKPLNAENKRNCICHSRILQLGLIFNPKIHLDGCHCYKSIYNENSTSLTCAQCIKRETFELNPRFDYGISYYNTTVKITEVLENQRIVIINYIFNYANFSIQNRVINEGACKDDISECTFNRPLLPYAGRDHILRCLCIADYFYIKKPIQCGCNPFVWQIDILHNPNILDLRYIFCLITEETDKNSVKTCEYFKSKPGPKPEDKVVVRIRRGIIVNILVIMEFILRRVEYTKEKFILCKCSMSKEGHYSCNCDGETEMCKKEVTCSCICVIPSVNAPNEVIECMCNPRVLQFGIQFNALVNHLEGCRCYQVINKDGTKSLTCDKCIRRISYEHQTRFNLQKDYTKTVVTIPPSTENQIEVIQNLIVQHLDISDQIVIYCSCTENLINCQCESSIEQFITREGILLCFCIADYYYTEYPIRCACNPLIMQPLLIYNETKYDFKYINCTSADLNSFIVNCTDTHKIVVTPHPADRAVVILRTPIRHHFADIIEYITTYHIYQDEEFNLCFDCTYINSQISCNCNNTTMNYTVEHMGSCLCARNPGQKKECICGSHVLQFGIIYRDAEVEACRCYHSIEDKTNLTSLVCRDCFERKSFEYNPRFDITKNIYGALTVHIDDNIQNQIEYIYKIIVRLFTERNDQIVNFCQCLVDLETCKCKYSVEPYLINGVLRCFCISDFYYEQCPYQCACNPFILEPNVTCDDRKFEFRYLDCTLVPNSKTDVKCKERPSSPKPASAEYKLVMRLRNIDISFKIIQQYLLQTQLYKYEPLISCNCHPTQDKYSCNCLNKTEVYTIHNKGYCLLITHNTGALESTECLCNSRILQFGMVYHLNSTILKGCHCYHSKYDKNNKNSLVCGQCQEVKSFEFNPHFDKDHNYSSVTIVIPRYTEHQINAIIEIIFAKFNSSDQFVNHCECTENMNHCQCDYNISAYIQTNGKMPGICVTDYFYDTHPIRCACNPFMIQPAYEYNPVKYDIRLVECTHSAESLRIVNCTEIKSNPPVAIAVLDTTVWREVQIKIIEEYILSYPQYSDEKFNRCGCSWNDVTNEFNCDCNEDTSKCVIENMCSCLCITPSASKENLDCTCNPRMLQIGYKYKTSINDFYGCRCYQSIAINRAKSLICHKCKIIPSYEQQPHFKLSFNYSQLIINITSIIIQNRIEIVIPVIMNNIPEVPHRLINYCNCLADSTNCTCQYPVKSYFTKNEECNCLCITDYFYTDYNLRCGCNPFIFQPSILHDTSRYHFIRLVCLGNPEDEFRMEKCQTLNAGDLPSIDQIVIDISNEPAVTIQTIITYIGYHRIYKGEVFNTCNCHRATPESSLNCTCIDPTVVCTIRDTCNCLCLTNSSQFENVECMCNPLSLQFGVIFNSTTITMEACHFYHPLRDKDTRSLVSHECVRKESYDNYPHFNLDYVYNISGPIKISSTTENQLSYILDIIRIYFEMRDRIFNRCQCTENLSKCTCKNLIHPYLQKNHKMPCLCIADYFYSDLPLQCGCNPFVFQVTFNTLVYSTSKFDFRWLECFEHDQSVKCKLIEREVEGPTSADKMVFDMTRLARVNLDIIIEHILSYTQYAKEHFNQCNCLTNNHNHLLCNCNDNTTKYEIEKRCSCLCFKFGNNANSICSCNSHALQLGIVFDLNIVEITACRCYNDHNSSNLGLKCDDCRKRESFEVNPRFDLSKDYRYEVEIQDVVENILINILNIKHMQMEFNDRIVNYCDCPENGINCTCAYAIEPFIRDEQDTMECFCISDYYYLTHPINCACNPFVTQQLLIYNSRIFDFRVGKCVAYLGDKKNVTCSLESLGNDPQYPEYKFVIKIRDLHIIDIGIIKEFLIKSLEFKYEEFNDCKCDSQLLCKCNKPTTEFNVTNKKNCLCHKTGGAVDCLCNPRILQVGIVFNPDKVELLGCRCYYPKNETENTLLCDECIKRESFEWNPRFDLNITYFGKTVYISSDIENQIDVIFSYIISVLELKHQIINHCECNGNLLDCKCDYPIEAYSQKNGTMPCFCLSDYYYKVHPVRCRCNPYILQIVIIYDSVKYDFIKADCISHNGDKDNVVCTARPGEMDISTDQVILDITHIVVIDVAIITEYIFTFPQFRGEKFNICQCSRHGTNGLKCDCKNDTSNLEIHNMRSCLCFTLYINGETHQPVCICNAHILQIGIIFDPKVITWEGCRCYNPGSSSKNAMKCIQCHKIESIVDAPRFDIVNKNYSIGVDPVEIPGITENQLVIIRRYIIEIFKNNDKFTNECACTEDGVSCDCRNKLKYYFQLNNKMPCFCCLDYFYNYRPMRCNCNPYILQLQYKYDATKFDFKYIECSGNPEGNIASCDVKPKPHLPQPRPPADLVVFDMTHIVEINMKHIFEYIWSYPQYHDHITKCKCLNNTDVLNCDCDGDTTKVTIQNKWSCLCFNISCKEYECLCNPQILQLGIIFDPDDHNILGCRCYHSIHDYQTQTLVCDHCIPRIPFSHRPRFDLSLVLKYDVILPNKTENIIVNILDVILNQTAFNNRLVDFCSCSEYLQNCSCKYPITPYSVNNTLFCFCIADYYFKNDSIQCGCNPFVLQPNLIYGNRLYDIRHVHCTTNSEDNKKVNCVQIPGSPEPHNPEYKQVLRLRNGIVTITEIKAGLSENEVLKDELYNLCTCHNIDGIQTCDCNDITTHCTIHLQCNCLCLYDASKTDCICNPRILQIGVVFDSEKTFLKGCRCYHSKSDEHTRSLICRNCVERDSFEMDPRFDQTTNYTGKIVKIPATVTFEMDDIYIFLVGQFMDRDKIVNRLQCLSDYKHCRADYSIRPYLRITDNVMPCVCAKDNLHANYTQDCACNPFVMQPTLKYENITLSYALCTSVNDDKNDINCTEIPMKGPTPTWSTLIIILEGEITIDIIIHHLEEITKKKENFNICNCTKISKINFDKGLSCTPCTYGAELYKQNKNTSCLCVHHPKRAITPGVECICHNYVLQMMLYYDKVLNTLVGCECYYSESDNGLICPKCDVRSSAPDAPSFTKANYTGVVVNIPLKAGVDITIIRPIILNHLNGSDKMINRCECADKFKNCSCTFPPDSYARSDGNIYCVCVDDYYNFVKPIQCGCNPFVWQFTYEYSKTKLDLRYMKCVTELSGKLDCVSTDVIKTTSLVVYNAKKIHLIDMNVVIEYLLKYLQYYKEDMILCSCVATGIDNMECNSCSSETVQYTTLEKVSCLCQKSKNVRDKKRKQCVCNPFILQSEYVFNPTNFNLTGCRCYHKSTDKNKESMTCTQCKTRESYELHPRFDLLTDYSKVIVTIPQDTENEIGIFLNFLVKDFKVEDQVVNLCKCTEDLKNCTCQFPVEPYLNNSQMNCFCISDYYYIKDPIQCGCNPYIFQPTTHTFNKVQDIRKSYCTEKAEGSVTCEVFSGNTEKNAVYRYVLNVRTLRVVNIGIIKEYLYKSKEFYNEQFISCDCTFKEDKKNGDKYECTSYTSPTNMYTIHNRANCLCVMPVHKTAHSRTECLCGPHVLQVGYLYNTKLTDLRGCRCYGDENNDEALTCVDCIKRVSFELNPHFDLQISYHHVEVVIENYVENQIEILLTIITTAFERDHQIVNLCECTEDYKRCRCDYPIKPYSVANNLSCICILDHYFIDYPVQCGCNPYLLQPKIIYDDEKYILRFVECTDPNNDKDNITCTLTSRNVNLHLPRPVFVNLRGTMDIHIITILEYLFCYIEYQEEKFNQCNCTKKNTDLSCDCKNNIETHGKNIMHNCLCILTESISSSCICNPRVQQFGISFNSSSIYLESCRCYHSGFDPNANTLKCHECHKRDSIAEHVRFDYSHNYSDVRVETIYNMEVHIETIIEIFVRVFNSTDQIVNFCKCMENSENCICDYPITNYLIPNGELHCICIDDFYNTIHPVQCGCNPYVAQPISSYNISQFSKEPNYFNFRQFICVQTVDAYNVKCTTLAYDHPLDTSVVSLQHLQYINIEIIETYFLMKRTESYNLCDCEYNTNGRLVCNHCNDITTQCSIKNPCNCFCIKDNNPKCLCNPRVLQFSLRFQSNVEFLGCRCYHSMFDKQSNRTLQCNQCLNRVSIDRAPRFDIHVTYRHVTIIVPATLERRIDNLVALIISKFKDVYQVVLNCLCTTGASPNCKCDYPYSVFAFDGVLNCVCMGDNSNPKYGFRCACNPYVLHPSLNLDNWQGIDVIRLICSSSNASSTTVHCDGTKVPPYDIVLKIPPVPVIHIQYILEILQRTDVFKDQPFTLCDCQQTKNNTLDCNCQNNTMGYTVENQCNCLCVHNLKSVLYRPVIECLCNAHIHQPRLTFDESVAMIDKCECYNNGRYDTFLHCSCRKTSSYKALYHNNYGHVTVEVPDLDKNATSSKRLEHVRDTILKKFAPEDKDYGSCRCMEHMQKCTCAKSIQEYSYRTVTPCFCMPDKLNKTYPIACVCNRNVLQPKLKFNTDLYDLQDCDCFEHHGDINNVTCHCSKKISYEDMESNHNYTSLVITIGSTVQKRIESVAQIIIKAFNKSDQAHNTCFCTEKLNECKCLDKVGSHYYYSALPCFCMIEDISEYPFRCICNRYILEPELKYDKSVFKFKDCYLTLQHGDTLYPKCLETTNPRTKPTWLKELKFFANTKLQTKETIETKQIVNKNATLVGKVKH